jgi:molybdopterin molybdotransferase
MQEKVSAVGTTIQINDTQLQQGTNVRVQGCEIKKASLALKQQTLLSPAAVGFLAAIGVTEVLVYPRPSIALIITGNELQQPGKPLLAGQVYESNSFMLNAALQQVQIPIREIFFVTDHLDALQQLLSDALLRFDMILLTGGVSAGDYDFVVQAASSCGITQLFHKVAQKPGKPLYFGTKQDRLVFGLPGNPSSVLTCFYQYVIPALEKITGRNEWLKTIQATLAAPYAKKTGLTHFLKGWYADGKVWPLPAQESYKLHSFATANCLIELHAEGADYMEMDLVTIHLLPS